MKVSPKRLLKTLIYTFTFVGIFLSPLLGGFFRTQATYKTSQLTGAANGVPYAYAEVPGDGDSGDTDGDSDGDSDGDCDGDSDGDCGDS